MTTHSPVCFLIILSKSSLALFCTEYNGSIFEKDNFSGSFNHISHSFGYSLEIYSFDFPSHGPSSILFSASLFSTSILHSFFISSAVCVALVNGLVYILDG